MNALLIALLMLQGTAATIEGRILYADGTPAAGVRVAAQLFAESPAAAAQSPVLMSITQTDTNGRYRLEGVTPGRYYVAAGALDSLTYYPGLASPDGALVQSVSGGAAVTGIDFRLLPAKVPCTVCKVSGKVTPPEQGQRIVLRSLSGAELRATVSADGSFGFAEVSPGLYRMTVYSSTAEVLDRRLEVRDRPVELDLAVPKLAPKP